MRVVHKKFRLKSLVCLYVCSKDGTAVRSRCFYSSPALVDKLKDHLKHHDRAARNFECQQCQQPFVQKSDLNRHIRGVHQGEPGVGINMTIKRKAPGRSCYYCFYRCCLYAFHWFSLIFCSCVINSVPLYPPSLKFEVGSDN
ncbi:unnamed protein product [Trichobilharzia regenti]|nr:unnamed protein product [Trichobilharzia regenti]